MRIPSTQAQNNFGKYLKYAEAGEEIVISRKGHDVAKIVPAHDMVSEEAADYTLSANSVSYEEFLELTQASEQRYELIDGVLYYLSAPSYKHQHAVQELMGTFYNWFKGKPCKAMTSPFDITIERAADNISVVQPDVFVLCDSRVDDKGKYLGLPTLVVEVLSPSTRTKDLIRKLNLYMASGVQEYWVADPDQDSVEVYLFQDTELADKRIYTRRADTHAYSMLYDGLAVSLHDLFHWI